MLGHLHPRGLEPIQIASRVSAKVSRPRKVFVLINNANPILDKDSPLYREVREAGWEVTEDGWEFSLRRAKSALAV